MMLKTGLTILLHEAPIDLLIVNLYNNLGGQQRLFVK